jgi:prophage regulatory protein
MSAEIWRKDRVLATIGMKNTWVYAAMKRGEFPASVKLGARAIGWRSSDVLAWLASRETKVQ